jgi:trimeric autotransporter adhesin
MKKKIYTISACLSLLLAASGVHAQTISTFAGDGISTSAGDGGAATAASFYYPSSVTRDAAGNTYVIEGSYIRKIDASGTISTIVGDGTSGFSGDGGPATAASFRIGDDFSDIVIDNAGNLYFTDVFNNRIRKVSPAGIISSIAGTASATFGGDGGPATAADLYRPYGLALDDDGFMYIADSRNHVVRKIDMVSGIINTVAGTSSSPGYGGDGGTATAATLRNPTSVAVDAAGNIYIAETGNHTIRRVAAATGNITTIVGDGTSGSAGDGGAATAARLNYPTNVSVDPAGNIFIADLGNDAVRKINTSGIISTVVGTNGTSGFSGDGGAATAATLNSATDFFLASNGDMYVTDANNYRVRLVTAASIALSGTSSSCIAGTNTLAAATTGGVWSSGNTAVATVSAAGVVTAVSAGTATISYGMGLGFGSTVYTVNPAPVPVVSGAGASLSVAGSFVTYQWLLGGSPISGATSATYIAATDGSYAVTVTDANGCAGTSAPQVVSGVGVNEILTSATLAIYPNPAVDGSFVMDVPAGQSEALTIIITDIIGKTVFQTTALSGSRISVKLNVPAGMYMIQAANTQTKYNTKITVN